MSRAHEANEASSATGADDANEVRRGKGGKRGTGWSMSPFAPDTARSGLRLADASLGEGGESTGVREVVGHPGWVTKLYKEPLAPDEADTLARLIELPGKMSWADMCLVDRHSAWPVARVTDRGETVGVIMPRIPDSFYVRFAYGEGGRTEPKELLLDHLVLQDAKFTALGLDPPSAARRRSTAVRFLSLGALMERYDVVYGDWSYRNALWSQQNGDVFLIDLDSCGIESRRWIRSHHWEDPLFPQGTRLTTHTDRYRMAVLTLRVLTGTRGDPRRALEGLAEQRAGDAELVLLLRRAVTTAQPSERPSVAGLLAAMEVRPAAPETPVAPSRPVAAGGAGAGAGSATNGSPNVSGWREVQPPPPAARRPKPVRPPAPTAGAGPMDADSAATTGPGADTATGATPPAPLPRSVGCSIAFWAVGLLFFLLGVLVAVR
ncbi:hypothetical protein ACH4E8_08350 [Streptomyces sp. NPDC017979]|uniref:hypothetical protein n=1 Tax=Streptomyces sp. NPDC017979 TaxID=3365024 RepID=UPI003791CE79